MEINEAVEWIKTLQGFAQNQAEEYQEATTLAITILERVKRLEEMNGKQSPWLEDVVDYIKTGEEW